MARPLRIEFAGAWYHVMNRGANRRAIYHEDAHRRMFLELLGDVVRRFHLECHAYCLMDNHYHLLLHTPRGQLGRAMRHLNSLYTQRFNRHQKSDGPLFRGRYKAILIDADNYLLTVSRYIHLNPVLAGLVPRAEAYRWSSYAAYVGVVPTECWLTTSQTLSLVGTRHSRVAYRRFVEQGLDEATARFYHTARQLPILGDAAFEASVSRHRVMDAEVPDSTRPVHVPELEEIVKATAAAYGVSPKHVLTSRRGRGQENVPRQVALYLSRHVGEYRLRQIAIHFGLGHYASVSRSAQRVRELMESNPDLARTIEHLQAQLRDVNRK